MKTTKYNFKKIMEGVDENYYNDPDYMDPYLKITGQDATGDNNIEDMREREPEDFEAIVNDVFDISLEDFNKHYGSQQIFKHPKWQEFSDNIEKSWGAGDYYEGDVGDADYERWRDDQLEQEDDHEHEAEYQPAEPDVNVPESNTCKHCGLDMPLPEPDPDFAHDDIPLPPTDDTSEQEFHRDKQADEDEYGSIIDNDYDDDGYIIKKPKKIDYDPETAPSREEEFQNDLERWDIDEAEGMIVRNDPGKARKQAQDHPLYHTAPAEDPNYDPDMPNFSFYRWMKQNEPGEFKKMVNYNKKKKGIPTEAKEYWNLMKTFAQLNEYESDTEYKDEEANSPHDLGDDRSDDKDWDEYDFVTSKEPRIDDLTHAREEHDEDDDDDKKVDEQSMKNYEQNGSKFSLKGVIMEKSFKDREGEYRKIGEVRAKSENDPQVSDAFKGYPADEYWIRAIKKPNEGKFELYVRKKPTKYTRTRVPKDLYDFVDEVVEDENKWYGHIPGSDNSEKD